MVEEAISFWTEIQRFEDLLTADPASLCFAPLSELYRKLGLLDDAISVAKKGCDLHPDYPGGFFALGTACLDKGLKDEARLALERVVSLNPDNVRAQRFLGQLYVEAGDNALAERALAQVLQQNPDDAESALLLRSIAPETGAESDEELLEEAEIIEELTELVEEPQEFEAVPGEPPPYPGPESEVSGFPYGSEFPEDPELSVAPGVSETSEVPVVAAPEVLEVPEVLPAPEASRVQEAALQRDPLTTATLAELYVSQGFLDKAIAIYQELLAADPGNHSNRLRCTELKTALERQKAIPPGSAPASPFQAGELPGESAPPGGAAEAELSRWLENIRRRRDGV